MRYFSLILLSVFEIGSAFGQIIEGTDTLYGNEWIDFDLQYAKVLVAHDGVYKISRQDLESVGVPVESIPGSAYQVFHNGRQIPIYVSTEEPFENSDFLLFYGEKNRSELDRYLFSDADADMINPKYSLITDSAAYFITWNLAEMGSRLTEVDNDVANPPAKTEWCWAHETLVFAERLKKETDAQGISKSNYTKAEGYATNWANAQQRSISVNNPYLGNVNPILSLRYSGNLGSHQLQISVNGQTVLTDEFQDYDVRQPFIELPNNILSQPMELSLKGLLSNNDQHRLAFVDVQYPRLFQFSGLSSVQFALPGSAVGHYLEISDFDASGNVVLWNLSGNYFLKPKVEGNTLKFRLPAHPELQQFVLFNVDNGTRTADGLAMVSFRNFEELDADYIIISNKKLFDDGSGFNWVAEYASYRASAQGGNFNPVVVDVQELYDQFAWGIHRHPLSIRNFALWAKKNWTNLQYILLVGKGVEYYRIRSETDLEATSQFYVPTWGVPGSDNLLVAGSNGYTPIVPVGRIACWNAEELKIYLDKVRIFEANASLPQTIDSRLWMKNVLHLGGGFEGNPGEPQLIRNYLKSFEDILAASRFGSKTMSFFKTSTDPIQQPQTDLIFDYINNGVSLITFFGHSGLNAFDLTIDFPENYHNKDKYYWMISLGCYAGNIHTTSRGAGENFVFMKEAGPIAFSATAGQGFITALGQFANVLYDKMGNEFYGQGIGNILNATNNHFTEGNYGIDLIRQQFNLLGDPALKLNPAPGPDYLIDASTVKMYPEHIAANQGEFEVEFAVTNIGQNVQDSLHIRILQQLPSGDQLVRIDSLVKAPGYSAVFRFKLPQVGKEAIGENRLFISVDSDDRIEELPAPAAEANNELIMSNGQRGYSFFVKDNSAVPLYPQEFAIVSQPDLVLKAYTTDPLAPERTYLFQLDTTAFFNSPIKLEHALKSEGGLLQWQPNFNWEPSRVYYWRISPDSLSEQEGYSWAGSSFVFAPGASAGWNQSHAFQFQRNAGVNLSVTDVGNWTFPEDVKEYRLTNAPSNVKRPGLLINNYTAFWYYYTPAAGYYIAWIDSIYKEPVWNYYPSVYGITHPWGIDAKVFMFGADANGRKQAMDFLRDVVSEGEYVLFMTVQNSSGADYQADQWPTDSTTYGYSLLNILEQDGGAQLARQLVDGTPVPYAIAYRKGHGLIAEKKASAPNEIIEMNFSLAGNWNQGYFTTPEIGPATSWDKLEINFSSTDPSPSDEVFLKIFGKTPAGNAILLNELKVQPQTELDLSDIDAVKFPKLFLQLFAKDTALRTAPQINFLRVYFAGTPEYVFEEPLKHFNLSADSLAQGQPLEISFMMKNIAPVAASDSLVVRYDFVDERNQQFTDSVRIPPLRESEQRQVVFATDTRQWLGKMKLKVELNAAYQPEITHLNNFLESSLDVYPDRYGPILDVTFDGEHILNGELVSANPIIQIRLKDENRYLMLKDTHLLRILLLYPDSANPVPVYFNSPEVTLSSSLNPENNILDLTYHPRFEKDGEYTLIVQAQDVSGNTPGSRDFKINFRVSTTRAISNIVNYPNPFSTSTRFVYTISGDRPPADYRLQIMTVSGRIIREVSKEELGPLKVGTHLTEFAWDGKDQFGDQLATGVYLFRFLYSDDKNWETLQTGADKYTVGGIGKMVLIK